MDNAKMGAIRPIQLAKFAYFRVLRVKLSSGKAHQERFFHQNDVQDLSGWRSRMWDAARGFLHRRTLRYRVKNDSGRTGSPDDLSWDIIKGFKPSDLLFIE